MPSDRSTFKKIEAILRVSRTVSPDSMVTLKNETVAQGFSIFLTRQYNSETDTFEPAISQKSIHRIINLSLILGLLDDEGRLTKSGRRALNGNAMAKVLARQAKLLLRENGIDFRILNSTILEVFQSTPPGLPTCRDLWEKSNTLISYSLFSKLVTLLADCGSAERSQKRIYLHFDEKI